MNCASLLPNSQYAPPNGGSTISSSHTFNFVSFGASWTTMDFDSILIEVNKSLRLNLIFLAVFVSSISATTSCSWDIWISALHNMNPDSYLVLFTDSQSFLIWLQAGLHVLRFPPAIALDGLSHPLWRFLIFLVFPWSSWLTMTKNFLYVNYDVDCIIFLSMNKSGLSFRIYLITSNMHTFKEY